MKAFKIFLVLMLAVIGLSNSVDAQIKYDVKVIDAKGVVLYVTHEKLLCDESGNVLVRVVKDTKSSKGQIIIDMSQAIEGLTFERNSIGDEILLRYGGHPDGSNEPGVYSWLWFNEGGSTIGQDPDQIISVGTVYVGGIYYDQSSTTPGYSYGVTFWLSDPTGPTTYDATFNVDFLSNPVTGASVNLTQGGSPIGSGTTSGGSCTIAGLANGTYDYSVTYGCADEATGTITIADGNVTKNVTLVDTQDPVPDVGTLSTITSQCSVGSLTAPTATDNCSGTITGTHNVSSFPITSSTTVTWTYDDGNGNTVTQNQSVIIDDVTAPVPKITNLPTITAECSVTSLTAPEALDNCVGTVVGTTGTTLPITSNTTIVWTYDDGHGNTSIQNQNIIIDDVTDPTIACPGNQTRNAAADHYYSVVGTEFNPTSTGDNCQVASVSNDFNSSATLVGAQFPEGNTTVIWTITDGDGNTATCSFVVTVNIFVGIKTLQDNSISIFPNPTHGIIIVNTNERIENITVLDISGKVILETTKNEIDLTNYEKGTYILKVTTKNGIFTKTIIKE